MKRRRSVYRSPAHFKRNGASVSGFHVRGHKLEIALGDAPPWVGQITVDPPHLGHVPSPTDGDAFDQSAMAVAMQTLADMIDPGWRGANANIVVDRGPPLVIAWKNGARLHPQFPLNAQNIVNTLRGICDQMSYGRASRAAQHPEVQPAARTKAPRKAAAPRAARTAARKPAGRGKASAAARKPAPRKSAARKPSAPRKAASKRNGGADFGGYGEGIAKGAPVRLSPHIDEYMMGDKYGVAKGSPGRDGMVSVKLDRSGRTVKLPAVALQRDYR